MAQDFFARHPFFAGVLALVLVYDGHVAHHHQEKNHCYQRLTVHQAGYTGTLEQRSNFYFQDIVSTMELGSTKRPSKGHGLS